MSSPTDPPTRAREVDQDYDENAIRKREQARLKANGDGDEGEEEEEEEDLEGGGGDNDDEEEDEEEDEDEDDRGRPKKRSKHKHRRFVKSFVDLEAEVEDEGEEDEEDEGAIGEYRDFIDESEVQESAAARRAHMQHQQLDRRERAMHDMEATELADYFRNQAKQAKATRYTGDLDQVPQRLLMPSVNDPSLWQVRVRPGRERDIVFSLIRKARDLEYTNRPLEIMSAFERSSLPGMIYVEARSAAHVRSAAHGLVGVFVSSPINLVPIEEMASLLRIKKKEVNIDVGSWVRIRRGRYQGDLAQVTDVVEPGERYTVKYIPRIDVSPQDEDKSLGNKAVAGKKRVRNALINTVQGRPPQKFFNMEEITRVYGIRSVNRTKNRTFTFQGDEYYNGYCLKEYKANQLAVDDVQPTLEEITKFSGPGADDEGVANKMDLNAIREAAQRRATAVLQPGDSVEVFEGQQSGVYGVLQSMSGDNVLIQPSLKDMSEVIEVPAKSVRKRFLVGEHVKVMSGKNVDETGLVIMVDGNTVTFLSDTNQQEITVFAKDLRTAAEVGTSNNTVGNYVLHDLVSLDQTTVGVIFQTGRDSFRVLDQYGTVHNVHPHQIAMNRNTAKSIALDHNRETFKQGDNMVEVDGAGRSGVVLHVYSFSAFLHNRTIKENGGVFVAQSSNLSRPDAVKRRAFNPSQPNLSSMSIGGPTPTNRGDRRLINVLVTIVKGSYKGYAGTIKDVNGTQCRVELQSTRKVITIEQEHLRRKDQNGALRTLSEPTDFGGRDWRSGGGGGGGGRGGFSNRASEYGRNGSQTPSGGRYGAGGKTPGWSAAVGRTPNPYADGGKTPAWSSSSKTPNPYATDGGKTPAWSSSSKTPNPYAQEGAKTPAWNTSSRTPNPYAAANAGGDAWNSSSRTPNPYAREGGRTPAAGRSVPGGDANSGGSERGTRNGDSYGGRSPSHGTNWATRDSNTGMGGYDSAPTPAVTAPTPYGSAPTPGPYGAPTPGPYTAATPYGAPTPAPYGAPTPYGGPTPGPLGAPTPAWNSLSAPTPGAAAADDRKDYLLGAHDIIVRIVPKYTSHGPESWRGLVPEGSTGRIISTLPLDQGFQSTASVRVITSPDSNAIGTEQTVPLEHLEPVPPEEGGRAYVLQGEFKGMTVTVQTIDEEDAYVITGTGQYPQISAKFVAKLHEE